MTQTLTSRELHFLTLIRTIRVEAERPGSKTPYIDGIRELCDPILEAASE